MRAQYFAGGARFFALLWILLSACAGDKTPAYDASARVGNFAPDVALQTLDGDTVRLSQLYKKSPLILSVYLGVGCPMCVMTLKQLSQHAYRFRSYGWNVVAFSADAPEENRAALASPNLDSGFVQPGGDFEVELFSDQNRQAMEAFGCYRRELDTERHGLFLIDTAGVIRFEYVHRRPFQDWNLLTDTLRRIYFAPPRPL
jgi:peroxiredoxin